MSKGQAAAYLGISPRTFDERVRAGRLPKSLDGTNQWDKVAIDRTLDKLSGLDQQPETEDPGSEIKRLHAEYRARRAARQAAREEQERLGIKPKGRR